MRDDPETQFEAFTTAYRLRDLDQCARYFSDDCEYAIFIPSQILPFGGSIVGASAIYDCHVSVDRDFELLKYEPRSLLRKDQQIRTQIEFAFRHRASGEIIDGVMRIEASFRDGKVVIWREFHDCERIEAFMRLCSAREAERNQPAA
jgi:ketosteroid isomerase-like protein